MIFDRFLKSKRLSVLLLLPIVAAVFVVFGFYVAGRENLPGDGVTMFPLRMLGEMSVEGAVIGGFIGLLLFAYMLFFLNVRHKFLSQSTALPSFIYILLTAGLLPGYGFGYLHIALFLLMLGFLGGQAAIIDSKSNGHVFNLGFFVCCAIVVYPKFVLLALWAICVLFFSGRSTLKDMVALLLGFASVLLFSLFFYFWTDRLFDFMPVFWDNLFSGEFLSSLTLSAWIRLGILLLLLLVALLKIINYYPVSVVNQRREIALLISLLFFLMLTLFVIPGIQMNFVYVLAWPFAYLYAQFFILQRLGWVSDILFLLLCFSCFLQLL